LKPNQTTELNLFLNIPQVPPTKKGVINAIQPELQKKQNSKNNQKTKEFKEPQLQKVNSIKNAKGEYNDHFKGPSDSMLALVKRQYDELRFYEHTRNTMLPIMDKFEAQWPCFWRGSLIGTGGGL